MFAVRSSASVLWHPNVHHSLLLLRALERPHTLLLDPHTTTRGRLPVPLLSECAADVRIQVPALDDATPSSSSSPVVLHKAEDILHVVGHLSLLEKAVSQPRVPAALLDYLEASTVSSHVMSAADALLVALNAGDVETIRQTHARVLELVERLETSLTDGEGHAAGDATEPLSTWPLFCTLQFLIEEGGLLTSAFPRTSKAYARLCQSNKAVAQHRRLVQRTVEQQHQEAQVGAGNLERTGAEVSQLPTRVATAYPAKGFLREVQRQLATYNRSVEESTTDGVTGEKGPLQSRAAGGRLGLQAVRARLPWTLQSTPLRKA